MHPDPGRPGTTRWVQHTGCLGAVVVGNARRLKLTHTDTLSLFLPSLSCSLAHTAHSTHTTRCERGKELRRAGRRSDTGN